MQLKDRGVKFEPLAVPVLGSADTGCSSPLRVFGELSLADNCVEYCTVMFGSFDSKWLNGNVSLLSQAAIEIGNPRIAIGNVVSSRGHYDSKGNP
jgi:hypothetical protein